jgi:hypothetical protein
MSKVRRHRGRSLSYVTDERLKSYLDSNQLFREQLCLAVLSLDKRFSDVRPRHPRGGPDGGRDIEAVFQKEQSAMGAVGFVNQANDSDEKINQIKKKFLDDLDSALTASPSLDVFVFFTNLNLTIGTKDELKEKSTKRGIKYCDILDRERIRISLDSVDGFAARFQYLNISLSEAEQASFFSRWGDDIQRVISDEFRQLEKSIQRILFLQEINDYLSHLTVAYTLKEEYSSLEVGHFRAFCSLWLKGPINGALSLLFGSSDRANRFRRGLDKNWIQDPAGINAGVSGIQFEMQATQSTDEESRSIKYRITGSSSGIGISKLKRLPISFSKDSHIRFEPTMLFKDLDDSTFLPILSESFAHKVESMQVYCNGYILKEIKSGDFRIDTSDFDSHISEHFTEDELQDRWVRLRPSEISSAFHIRFFEATPKRLFEAERVELSTQR